MASQDEFSPYPDFIVTFNSQEHSQSLLIPEGCYMCFPDPLPVTAALRKPDDKFWTVVEWTRTENDISFQEGWEEFIKTNGIIDKDLLLFAYDYDQCFLVQIYRNGLPFPFIKMVGDDHMEEGEGSSKKAQRERIVKKVYPANILERHLDDPKNPYFISTSSSLSRVLTISKPVIKDNGLEFEDTINLIDGLGDLKTSIGKYSDRVVVKKWYEIYKRNDVKEGDTILCELFRDEDNVVRNLKVHFMKN